MQYTSFDYTKSGKHTIMAISEDSSQYEWVVNTLRPRQDGRHFADDIFKCIFLMKTFDFRLKFYWSLFLRAYLTIFQDWFR